MTPRVERTLICKTVRMDLQHEDSGGGGGVEHSEAHRAEAEGGAVPRHSQLVENNERENVGGGGVEHADAHRAEDSDEDLEVTFSLTYEEIPGKRKNSVLWHTADDHLWRKNRNMSETKKYLYCYHSMSTVDSRVTNKCPATAMLDLNTRRIVPKKPHNHEPDLELLDLLKLRDKVLSKAESSNVRLCQVFEDETRGQEGACRLGFYTMSRWVTHEFSIECVIHS